MPQLRPTAGQKALPLSALYRSRTPRPTEPNKKEGGEELAAYAAGGLGGGAPGLSSARQGEVGLAAKSATALRVGPARWPWAA
jgi:hypothetical protein